MFENQYKHGALVQYVQLACEEALFGFSAICTVSDKIGCFLVFGCSPVGKKIQKFWLKVKWKICWE